MKIKNIINNIFEYTEKNNYSFTLPNNSSNSDNSNTQLQLSNKAQNKLNTKTNIYQSLDVNIEYLKTRLNLLINTDYISREFTLNARGKQYKALLLYIDGMSDTQLINDFVLKPLMLRNKNNLYNNEQNKVISEAITNNITVKKIKKFNLTDYIENCLIPQSDVKKQDNFDDIINGINSGNCALFIETLNIAFDIDVKGFKQRSIDKPENEIVIKGPHEAFVENIRTNTSLLRRLTNNENLIIENTQIGKITQTQCSICYLKNITNEDLVAEVKYRLNNLEIDSLLSIGELEQLITTSNVLGIPKVLGTERPDNAVKHLLQGRVIILVNGSPYALIMPAILIDFLTSPEDTNLKPLYSNFVKRIRILASLFALLLPGIYVAITSFHIEILPTELLYTILASRQSVPFPIIFEILIMEISFEIIREASIRVPAPIGPTLGIVGALVLGQAAVSAGIVSPILIIIVAITGISSFAIPDYTFSFHLRYFRFAFIILGFSTGFLGIGIGIFIYLTALCNEESFGVSYTTPYAPINLNRNDNYLLSPIWQRENRPSFLSTKKEKKQPKITMKWKY